jgi:DHA1 family bicyclomycin/chloramphenicol resistance-like MFS transporter
MASFFIIFIADIDELIVLRFFQGLGGCCGTVIARVMIRDQFNGGKAIKFFAILSMGMAIAFIISPVCGGFLVYYSSWKCCFIVMTAIGIMLLFSIQFFMVETQKKRRKIKISFLLNEYKTAFCCKDFILHTLVISFSWTGFFLIVMEYPAILMVNLKILTLLFGLIFPIILLGYFLGTKATKWNGRFGIPAKKMAFLGVIIMFFSSIFSLFFNGVFKYSVVFLIASGFIYLFGMGIQMPNSQYLAIPEKHKYSAIITSLLYLIEMITTAVISHFIEAVWAVKMSNLWISILILTQASIIAFFCLDFLKKSMFIAKGKEYIDTSK